MKKIRFLLLTLFISNLAIGQTLNVQAGVSSSNLNWENNNLNLDFFDENLTSFSLLIGIDYLNKKYYNVSSNIGYIRKGGQETVIMRSMSGEYIGEKTQKAKLYYGTINTTVDFKIPIRNKVIPYISIGPRIDYLVGYSNQFDTENENGSLNKLNYGLLFGGGIKYELLRFIVGIKTVYYWNFGEVASSSKQGTNSGGTINDKTVAFYLTFGFNF